MVAAISNRSVSARYKKPEHIHHTGPGPTKGQGPKVPVSAHCPILAALTGMARPGSPPARVPNLSDIFRQGVLLKRAKMLRIRAPSAAQTGHRGQRRWSCIGSRPGARVCGTLYSITSSARSRIDGGTARPSALAVLRFRTISNFVGNCTGRSPGFAPRRMRST